MVIPWISIPAAKAHIQLPLSLEDREIRIMFKDIATIDDTIEKLQDLKKRMGDKETFMHA